MKKRDAKRQDKWSDDKSDVSAKTTKTTKTNKTNKTTGGKALDKHCPLCDLKLVTGAHWSRHCKVQHPGVEV